MMDPASTDDVLHAPASEVDLAVAEVQRGSFLLKFGRSGRPQKRFVRVTDEGDALYWVSRRKKRADSTRECRHGAAAAAIVRAAAAQGAAALRRGHARGAAHVDPRMQLAARL